MRNKMYDTVDKIWSWIVVGVEVLWEAALNIAEVLIPFLLAIGLGSLLILFLSVIPKIFSDVIMKIFVLSLISLWIFFILKSFIDRCKIVKKQHEIRKDLENKK
ncbi:hypothetical protein KNV65_gp072 [Enterococcus phage 9183]|uniref:Uncharacterized protein n=1 Tax=Enterococcus phage 9183 TaxID=2763102 RepID=A0A7L7SXG9_9CAUD|nr:hypothetical protein KNV65_gp072 [Enterococcus phage 9183]QOC57565.1 hypothetical protein phi9183_ORF072 [Enterococcus phage 9183]